MRFRNLPGRGLPTHLRGAEHVRWEWWQAAAPSVAKFSRITLRKQGLWGYNMDDAMIMPGVAARANSVVAMFPGGD